MNKVEVQHKYLEPGHTQMEVDNVHSVIGKEINKRGRVNLPADYVDIVKTARKTGPSYKVKGDDLLESQFFKNYDLISTIASIRPGKVSGDPKVDHIRALKYTTHGEICYKLRHTEDWSPLPQRYTVEHKKTEELYKTKRILSLEKFTHLQELKESINRGYHSYYDNLPHALEKKNTVEKKPKTKKKVLEIEGKNDKKSPVTNKKSEVSSKKMKH